MNAPQPLSKASVVSPTRPETAWRGNRERHGRGTTCKRQKPTTAHTTGAAVVASTTIDYARSSSSSSSSSSSISSTRARPGLAEATSHQSRKRHRDSTVPKTAPETRVSNIADAAADSIAVGGVVRSARPARDTTSALAPPPASPTSKMPGARDLQLDFSVHDRAAPLAVAQVSELAAFAARVCGASRRDVARPAWWTSTAFAGASQCLVLARDSETRALRGFALVAAGGRLCLAMPPVASPPTDATYVYVLAVDASDPRGGGEGGVRAHLLAHLVRQTCAVARKRGRTALYLHAMPDDAATLHAACGFEWHNASSSRVLADDPCDSMLLHAHLMHQDDAWHRDPPGGGGGGASFIDGAPTATGDESATASPLAPASATPASTMPILAEPVLSPVLRVSMCGQTTAYTCGAAALACVLAYHHGWDDLGERHLARALGTTAERGTSPAALRRFGEAHALTCDVFCDLSVGESVARLRAAVSCGLPVVCIVQMYPPQASSESSAKPRPSSKSRASRKSDRVESRDTTLAAATPPPAASQMERKSQPPTSVPHYDTDANSAGHYVVVNGVVASSSTTTTTTTTAAAARDSGTDVMFMDSACDGGLQRRMSLDEFVRRWHDRDEQDVVHAREMLVFAPAPGTLRVCCRRLYEVYPCVPLSTSA